MTEVALGFFSFLVCSHVRGPVLFEASTIYFIINNLSEPARHRRERRCRADARVILRFAGARSLFESHHSSMALAAALQQRQQPGPGWQCGDCGRNNGGGARFCQGCGVIKTRRSIDLPPLDKGGSKGGRSGSSGRGRSNSRGGR